jgi:hypothetical protein
VGIDLTALRSLLMLKRLQLVDFSNTVTLGRHEIFFTKEEYEYVTRKGEFQGKYTCEFVAGLFQESLLKAFGAKNIDSIDASSYEGATISHNFNEMIPNELREKYSLFVDFGSIEHIFDVKAVLRNIEGLLKVGGHALILTDANGGCGHGLYQFSPEFFYSAFSNQNGFSDTVVFLIDEASPWTWLMIKPPKLARGRVNIPSRRRFCVLCLTQKTSSKGNVVVEQSDYVDSWRVAGHRHARNSGERKGIFRYLRAMDITLYLRVRSAYRSVKRRAAFSKLSHPFVPELATGHPHNQLTSLWSNTGTQ